ncbi:hypothetical protein HK096_002701, partial [Nowakowskiella sp. JEL0078]
MKLMHFVTAVTHQITQNGVLFTAQLLFSHIFRIPLEKLRITEDEDSSSNEDSNGDEEWHEDSKKDSVCNVVSGSENEFKNIVVIGGSCVGMAVAMRIRMSKPLPTPYRLVIIEKNSHFHYMFAFPRASVFPGISSSLFAPYNKLFKSPNEGVMINAKAVSINSKEILLDRFIPEFPNKNIPYEYLIYGTGAKHPEPGNLCEADTKVKGIATLKRHQDRIKRSKNVLIIGGGAVGLELAAEIKEHYPRKKVTLIHSRDRYLEPFKKELHDLSYRNLKSLGVRQILNDRVLIPKGGFTDSGKKIVVTTKSGKKIESDLQILCTGMIPNSSLLSTISPQSINPANKLVKVLPTLQIIDPRFPKIFAAGDVVDLDDIKSGYAAWAHAYLAIDNILKMIEMERDGRKLLQLNKHKT